MFSCEFCEIFYNIFTEHLRWLLLRAGFETPQNLSSDFIEWSCVAVITTTPQRHMILDINWSLDGISLLVYLEAWLIFQNVSIRRTLCKRRKVDKHPTQLVRPLFLRIKFLVSCIQAGSYIFKVNNWNNRTRCEICSKLTIKTPEWRHWRRSGNFIVNFEHISRLVLVFLLLTLSR